METRTETRPPVIRTERLSLRPFMAEDEDAMVDMLTDPRVSATYMLPDFRSREEAAALFARLTALSGQPGHFIYGFYLRDRLIGFLNDVAFTADTAEVGYVVAPAWQNHGYATEALRACIGVLFSLGFDRVAAGYFAGNEASRRVMEKCGLRPAGYSELIDYRGREMECVYCEICREKP